MKKILERAGDTLKRAIGATNGCRSRGRPRSFDRAAALDAAMRVFWQKGFEATSISDLTEAMGVNPPSLYAAFGDKERLFLEAIERYQEERRESCPYVDEPTAKAAVERLLTYLADEAANADQPRGCLMVMTMATTGCSPELQVELGKRRAEGRVRMKARIERGIREGDVPPGTDAGALTDFYATIVTGMAMRSRDGSTTRKSLLATVKRAMQVFPEPAAGAGSRSGGSTASPRARRIPA